MLGKARIVVITLSVVAVGFAAMIAKGRLEENLATTNARVAELEEQVQDLQIEKDDLQDELEWAERDINLIRDELDAWGDVRCGGWQGLPWLVFVKEAQARIQEGGIVSSTDGSMLFDIENSCIIVDPEVFAAGW